MEFCRNVSISTDYRKQDQVLASPPPCALTATASPLDDLFPAQITDVDVGLEWLSVFVEDCLTSTGNCLPAAAPSADIAGNMSTSATTPPKSPKSLQRNPQQLRPSFLQKYLIPVKPRSKRKRVTSMQTRSLLTSWSYSNQNLHFPCSDPPLLQQTHWLADSELIVPRKEEGSSINSKKEEVGLEDLQEQQLAVRSKKHRLGNEEYGSNGGQQQQPRRCTHCLAQRTPQWRAGPMGPKTLCNACGVRYKSGRLLPEYRPAKSPTFVSFLHSNSHKKVLEMRMAMATSSTPV